MAWMYCAKCEAEQAEPTDEQVLTGQYLCPQCGHHNFPNKNMNDVVLSVLERLAILEEISRSSDLSTVVLAQTVELSLLPNEARWLKALVQNPVYSNESDEDVDYRQAIFHKIEMKP